MQTSNQENLALLSPKTPATAATQVTTFALMHFRPHVLFRLKETPELRAFLADEQSELKVYSKYLELVNLFTLPGRIYSQPSNPHPSNLIEFPPKNLYLIKQTEELAL